MSACCDSNIPVNIVQGQDKVIPMTLILKSSREYVPLNLATAISLKYLNADGSVLTHTLLAAQITIVNGPSGKMSDTLSEVETAALNPNNNDVILSYTIGGLETISVLKGFIFVEIAPF